MHGQKNIKEGQKLKKKWSRDKLRILRDLQRANTQVQSKKKTEKLWNHNTDELNLNSNYIPPSPSKKKNFENMSKFINLCGGL